MDEAPDRETAWAIYAVQSSLARAPFFALPAALLGLLASPLQAISLVLVALGAVACSTFAEHWLQGAEVPSPWRRFVVGAFAGGALSGGCLLGVLLVLSDYSGLFWAEGAPVALNELWKQANALTVYDYLFAAGAGLPWGVAVANHPVGEVYSEALPACVRAAALLSLGLAAAAAVATQAFVPGALGPLLVLLVTFTVSMTYCVACLPLALFVLNTVDAFEEWWWRRPTRRAQATPQLTDRGDLPDKGDELPYT